MIPDQRDCFGCSETSSQLASRRSLGALKKTYQWIDRQCNHNGWQLHNTRVCACFVGEYSSIKAILQV